jgi:type II secretory pathway pseudopilin PulG
LSQKRTNNSLFAFTLAEVLITLGIIGIVAALTIPIIINNSDKQRIVSQVKEDFSILAQASSAISNDCGGDIAGCITNPANGAASIAEVAKFYRAKLSLAKDCIDGSSGCFPNVVYKRLDNSNGSNFESGGYPNSRFVLANGTSVAFGWNGAGYIYFYVYFDINGAKGPNQYGKDWFAGYYNANTKTFTPGPANGDCSTTNVGTSCAVNIMRDGDIIYY